MAVGLPGVVAPIVEKVTALGFGKSRPAKGQNTAENKNTKPDRRQQHAELRDGTINSVIALACPSAQREVT